MEDCTEKELEFWNGECPSYFRCSSPDLLKEKLLKSSLCDDEEEDFWETSNIDGKKNLCRNRGLQKAAFEAILKRNTYIYTKWFDTLNVKGIMPDAMDEDFEGFLDKCFRANARTVIDEENNPFGADVGADAIEALEDYAFFPKQNFFFGIFDPEWICADDNFDLVVIINKADRKKLQKQAEEAGWSPWLDTFYKHYTLISLSDEAKHIMLRAIFQDIEALFGSARAEGFKGCLKRKFADVV